MLQPLWVALQFLTSLPVRLKHPPTERELGFSLLCYPLVGFALGGLLWGLAQLLGSHNGLLPAALLLTVWVASTGALHLDGLADTADAWLGGIGNHEKTLAIMKDPRSGPAAVVAIVLVLLLKMAALQTLMTLGQMLPLVLAPLLGRTVLILLFVTIPYARPGGLGDGLARHAPKRIAWMELVVVAFSVAALGVMGLWALIGAASVFLALRSWMLRRLGGTTGDTAGALVELTECAVLVACSLN